VSQGVSKKQAKSSYKIAVMGGDGTGPEVVNEGLKVLKALGQSLKINFEWLPYDLGGERYKKTGDILPDSALAELRKWTPFTWEPSAIRT
jgi:3-isopropylmalate dehydrogenase